MGISIVIINEEYKVLNPTIDLEIEKSYQVKNEDIEYENNNLIKINAVYISVKRKKVKVYIGIDRFRGIRLKFTKDNSSPDKVINQWGYSKDLRNVLTEDVNLHSFLYKHIMLNGINKVISLNNIDRRLSLFRPIRSVLNHGNMAIYQTREKLQEDRQTSLSPGKTLKKMFPEIEQKILNEIVDKFNENYSKIKLKMFESKEAKDFKHAYSHDISAMNNPRTTGARKSLADSCMHKTFSQLDHHPASAYASGDFKIFWTEDNEGKIASRCVVLMEHHLNPQAGPIYGTSEHALDIIENKLKEINADTMYPDWEGGKLNKYLINYDEYIGPYLDVKPQRLDVGSEHLIIDNNGIIDGSQWQGILIQGQKGYCEHCEDEVEEEDMQETFNQIYVCSDCLSNNYSYCEYAGEYIEDVEFNKVYTYRNGEVVTTMASEYEIDNSGHYQYVEHDNKTWDVDYTAYSEYLGEYVSNESMENGDFSYSDWDEDIYPSDQIVNICDGSNISIDELEGSEDTYVLNENNGVYELQEDEDLIEA